MRRRTFIAGSVATLAGGAARTAWTQQDALLVAAFSRLAPGAAIPEPWRDRGIASSKARTRYTLVDDGGTTVVRADAAASASALSRTIRAAPAEYPFLRWRWKIANTLNNSDIHSKAGDDFPARLYVMFDYPLDKLSFGDRTKLRLARTLHDPTLPAATLCYAWDSKAPAGTMVPSAYTDRVRLIVVESGASRVNQWLTVERDLAADFKAAFGDEAPAITGVAIATDTDNTGETATAFFGDISFNKQKVTR